METTTDFEHVPVLFTETIEALCIADNRQNVIVDATLGLGGHASEIVRRLHDGDIFIGFDRDIENLTVAEKHLRSAIGSKNVKLILVHANFALLRETLKTHSIPGITGICYDLGVSSAHFDDAKRGFSFRFDGPLDMRFDRSTEEKTAADLVNTLSERELFHIFKEYGEEPKGLFVARGIVEARKTSPITTTAELAKIIEDSSFDPKSKLRVFQALRIEVNSEFKAIEDSIADAIKLLLPEGRLAVITFHSLEDRLVKTLAKEYERDIPDPITGRAMVPKILKKVHKKPIEPSEEEVRRNGRSRSAKLRVYEKLP